MKAAIFMLLTSGLLVAPQPADQSSFKVNVALVVLNATVHDRQGHVIADLRQQDFEVYEDGVRQSLRLFRHDDAPVAVGLVIDHSSSMRLKLQDVVTAARLFIQSSSSEDQMFVVNFNEKVTRSLPAFSNRVDELARAISNKPAAGMTALYDAILEARQHLEAATSAKKVLLVVSDGGDNASKHNLHDVVSRLADQSNTLLYAIGIFDADDEDRNPTVLKRLAEATGGEAFFPHQTADIKGTCEHVAKEIRQQYTLGYVSSNPARPGKHHVIRVVAHAQGKKIAVRTRSGYTNGVE